MKTYKSVLALSVMLAGALLLQTSKLHAYSDRFRIYNVSYHTAVTLQLYQGGQHLKTIRIPGRTSRAESSVIVPSADFLKPNVTILLTADTPARQQNSYSAHAALNHSDPNHFKYAVDIHAGTPRFYEARQNGQQLPPR